MTHALPLGQPEYGPHLWNKLLLPVEHSKQDTAKLISTRTVGRSQSDGAAVVPSFWDSPFREPLP